MTRASAPPRLVYRWSVADVQKWLRRHLSDYHSLYSEHFLQVRCAGWSRALYPLSGDPATGGSPGRCRLTGGSTGRCRLTGGSTGRCRLTGGSTGRCRLTGGSTGRCRPTGGSTGRCRPTGGSTGRCRLTGGSTGRCRLTGGVAVFYGHGCCGDRWHCPAGSTTSLARRWSV